MKRVLPVVLLSSAVLFAVSVLAQTTVVVIPLGGKKAAGDVVAAEVLEGKTFSNKDEVGIDGAMVNNEAMTFHPGTADQTVPEGYHNGSGIVKGDIDLVSGNIRSGVALFGVDGSAIEPSGTATADHVLAGQTFSNASGAATGSMPNVGEQSITPGATEQTISQGYHDGFGTVQGDANLAPGNIKTGATIFGVTGTTIEASGTAAPAQVLSGQTFSNASGAATGSMINVEPQTITPGTSAQPISQGYHDGSGSVAGDAALVSGNIRSGVALFGVSGTSIETSGTATADQVLAGQTFSNASGAAIGSMTNVEPQTITPGTSAQPISQGYHNGSGSVNGDANLVSGNIRSGVALFGVSGTSIETSGTAAVDQVLAGQTFSNVSGAATGSMTNVGEQSITPGATEQTISQGYHNGTGSVVGDAALVSGNIRSGVALFGVVGNVYVVNTGSGDATAGEILSGKKAWVDGAEVTGTVPAGSSINGADGSKSFIIPDGLYSGNKTATAIDADLTSANIKVGVSIFGQTGIFTEETVSPMSAGDLLSSKVGYINGGKVTGTMPTQTLSNTTTTVSAGYYSAADLATVDADLAPGNIRSGVALFGVGGDLNVVNTGSGDAVAGEILSSKKAWVDGVEVTGTVPAGASISGADGSKSFTIIDGLYSDNKTVTANDANLLAQNIKSGTTIFGVTGTFMPPVAEGTVTSVTGQVWMNRNLGASRAATSLTDTYAYGDLYQWGRLADGHQSRTALTTWTLSTTDVPGHGSFIKISSAPYDWRTPQNHNLWQGVSGVNNPCPAGFRLPTGAEWEIERASWSSNNSAGAFASPLQLVPAGWRSSGYGALGVVGSYGYYWSSTVNGSNSGELLFSSIDAHMMYYDRANGNSVRCLKD